MATVTEINSNYTNAIDKTIALYGDLSFLFKLVDDNSLTGVTQTIEGGETLTYDNEIAFIEKTKVLPSNNIAEPTIKEHRIQVNQTLFDLAIQFYGNIEALFDIIENSEGIDNVNQNELTNLYAVYTEQATALTKYFKKNNITIATANYNSTGELNRSFDMSFDLSFG